MQKQEQQIEPDLLSPLERWTGSKKKGFDKKSLKIIAWIIGFSFPLWIYGLGLAVGKLELQPIVAMLVMTSLSGILLWKTAVAKLKNKTGKNLHGELK